MTFRPLIATLAVATTCAAAPALAQTLAPQADTAAEAARTVKVLPPDVSRTLKLAPMPASQPVPLLIGTYWNCDENAQGLERCSLVLVVCNDDQSFCVQV